MKKTMMLPAALLCALVAGCHTRKPIPAAGDSGLTMRSTTFEDNGAIPREYSCDGSDKAPPLEWSGVPADAKSLALIVEDPDAPKGTFTHWVVYDIPPTETGLKDAASLPSASHVGKNDKGENGYTGPCPPSGKHRYVFNLFALDTTIGATGLSADDLLSKMKGHILAQGRLTGTFQRSR